MIAVSITTLIVLENCLSLRLMQLNRIFIERALNDHWLTYSKRNLHCVLFFIKCLIFQNITFVEGMM